MKRVLVLLNPHAGSAHRIDEMRRALFDARPRFESLEIIETESARDAGRKAREASHAGIDVIAAAGGDGAINSVVSGLMEARDATPPEDTSGARLSELPAFAALPLGTGNDFSRTLSVGVDPDDAVAALVAHHTRRMDVVRLGVESADGSAQRRWFINAATGGNSGDIVDSMTDDMKEKWGAWCYVRGAIDVLTHLTRYHLRLRWDDEAEASTCDTYNVIVANGRTAAGGVHVAWPANPEDGLLDVVIVKFGEAVDVAAITAALVLGDYLESENVLHRRARRLTVESDPDMTFSADGEPLHGRTFTFEVLPAVLAVVVGAGYVAQPHKREQAV